MKNDKKNDGFERKKQVQSRVEREKELRVKRSEEEDGSMCTYHRITTSRYRDIGEPTASRELPKIFLANGEPLVNYRRADNV